MIGVHHWTSCVLVCLLACNVGNGLVLTKPEGRATTDSTYPSWLGKYCPVTLQEPARGIPEYAVFVHHKTGTDIAIKLVREAADMLHIPYNYCIGHGCNPGSATVYTSLANGRFPVNAAHVDKIFSQCPDMRAVHLVRRFTSMLVSDYIYTKAKINASFTVEERSQYSLSDALLQHPVSWGIQRMCEELLPTFSQILDIHEHVDDKHVLEVRLEQLDEDYDNTTQSIWGHFLGSNHAQTTEFVRKASKWDLARMTDSEVPDKISSERDKAEAKVEVQNLFKAGSPCIMQMMRMEAHMGYSPGFSF